MRTHFGAPPPILPARLPADEVLTQYGRKNPGVPTFRDQPRIDRDSGQLSMIRGRMSVEKATRLVCDRRPDGRDRVRYTTVGRLEKGGFGVGLSPTIRNPYHVSVGVPGGARRWTVEQVQAFVSAFAEEVEAR